MRKKLVTIEFLFRLMETPKTGSDKCLGKLLSTCTSSLENSLPPVNYPVFLRFSFFFKPSSESWKSIKSIRRTGRSSRSREKEERKGRGEKERLQTVINLYPSRSALRSKIGKHAYFLRSNVSPSLTSKLSDISFRDDIPNFHCTHDIYASILLFCPLVLML